MIASVARASGRTVREVGADSYALTLWTYLHGKDAQHLEELVREAERIDLAEIVTRGYLGGTQAIVPFRNEFRAKIYATNEPVDIEELKRRADALWLLHESKKRPVS